MEDQDGHDPPAPQNSNQDEGGREEEEEEEVEGETGEGRVSEYESERLKRIKENRARLEALGLLRSPSKHPQGANREKKTARKRGDGDDDYRPSDEDRNDEDEDYEPPPTGSRRNLKPKGRKKVSFSVAKTKKSPIPEEKNIKEDEVVDDDEASLQQAIALSLGSVTECSTVVAGRISQNSRKNIGDAQTNESKETVITQDTSVKKKKRRKLNNSRVQLTEDEVVAFFFSFDEAGKGHITMRDLRRMAIAHDFSWSEMETALMIHCFDSDKDGKLSLEEFRRIVSRCNLMQERENC